MMKNYQNHAMTDAEARQALADACKQVETNLPLYTYQCQNHSSVNDIYPGCANNQWTCGFWPGEIWLAYEATGDEKFKTAALIQVDSFADRIDRKVEVDHHDMGFLYSPTCVAAWKLVGSEKGKNAAIAAADQLLTRYQPSGKFLQAWGTMDDPDNYRYIIDCMLNVPLLYWAGETTGNDHYREIAAAHTATTLANSFRPDGSTYHTFFMNPDGTPKGGCIIGVHEKLGLPIRFVGVGEKIDDLIFFSATDFAEALLPEVPQHKKEETEQAGEEQA